MLLGDRLHEGMHVEVAVRGDPLAFGGALVMSTSGPTIGRCTFIEYERPRAAVTARWTDEEVQRFSVEKPKPKRVRLRRR